MTNYGYKLMLRAGGGPQFPGSIGVRGTTLINLVTDILEGFVGDGWRKIVVLDWHLKNVPFVLDAIDEVVRKTHVKGLKILKIDNPNALGVKHNPTLMDELFGDDFPGWWVERASVWETSAMMAASPELVREEKILDGSPPRLEDYDIFPVPEDAAPPSRVFWKASLASTEEGEKILDAVTDAIIEVIDEEFPH